jgi:hypothetical protein
MGQVKSILPCYEITIFTMVQVIALKNCLHRRLIGLEVLVHDVGKTNTQVNCLGFMNARQLASGCGFNSSLGHVRCGLKLPKFNAFNHVHSTSKLLRI